MSLGELWEMVRDREGWRAAVRMGFFQAIVREWIAISFSSRSSQPRDGTQVSRIVDRRFTVWATREVTWSVSGGP